jgi:hypothetical protein
MVKLPPLLFYDHDAKLPIFDGLLARGAYIADAFQNGNVS